MNKFFKFLFHRIALIGLLILFQMALLVLIILQFNEYFDEFFWFCQLLSLAAVIRVISNRSNPGYKIAWISLIAIVPMFGVIFYFLFGRNQLSRRMKKSMAAISQKTCEALKGHGKTFTALWETDPTAAGQSRYIQNYAFCPVFQKTESEYLPIGEAKFERMVVELKKAERYIFLEYFIVEAGLMWDTILEILVEKVRQGITVRMLYDDFGCMLTLPYRYDRHLESLGIHCHSFNPFVPVMTTLLNNRDHRKICVIDGKVGFTGGVNLADEYINKVVKHGHWKDCAVLLRGEAVWSLTVMFLTMWNYVAGTDEDYFDFMPNYAAMAVADDGFVQPFTDNPLDNEPTGETVYFNMIVRANRYIYINTPYLIIGNEMVTALCNSAKSGVDVRIVTPHIPDKAYVHSVTRAYYEVLIESGVKIYEYTPGFIHSKTFAVDDEYGIVGTINLDYRSLYLHFECATWLYKTKSVLQIKEDFLKTLEACQRITLKDCQNVPWYRRLGRSLLRIFAPLM